MHLDRICHLSDDAVAAVDDAKRLVFQPAQRGIGFRQEVAGAAGGVEEFQLRNLVLEGIGLILFGLGHRCGFNVR